ncbi:hypothetical protein PVIIG_03768 [Plasmodium vivax India VII]|uniref:Uncharacterized protein n=1 Tax=Plasmodium vivax India VII TaxID=1077284 RepID=A0A0J9SIW2_PLAVI|nr:hypothetical protein PVIIG_03768 [Plasmodium vivax India VII]
MEELKMLTYLIYNIFSLLFIYELSNIFLFSDVYIYPDYKSSKLFPRELTNMFSDYEINYKICYKTNEISTFMQLNNDQSNNLEQYKNDLKYKLARNSGLKKWDCYCEKKIFDKIEEFNKIKE